jgi:sigma-B regulation protein RsbU (phosphoserine phosphatase)
LIIAALVIPLRNLVQRFVDYRFFRRKHDYPTTLALLGREIAQAGELERLLNIAVDRLQEALLNRSVAAFLRRSGERVFSMVAKVGLPDEIVEKIKFAPDSPALPDHAEVSLPKLDLLPEGERAKLVKLGCALVLPVPRKGELAGFLTLGEKLSDEAYDLEDMTFLAAVADQIAIGLENLRLAEQQRDFDTAHEIQQALLPKNTPQLAGFDIAGVWQPARAVGGDYYDAFTLENGNLALLIADVSGKGMPAALLMSNLQAAVKAFASEAAGPSDLCRRVNKVICGNATPGRFITFFYGVLDTATRRLTFSNAGHNPPLVLRPDNSRLHLDQGTPLGLFPKAAYAQAEAELAPGDILLLFTDGVTEAANSEEEEFGEDRLVELLVPHRGEEARELQQALMDGVSRFCEGYFHDDATLTVVVVR